MSTVLRLGDVAVHVTLKDIKNVHLGVYPPGGRVRIAAPARMKMDAIRVLAISKLSWIRRQQRSFRGQDRETRREYVNGESHYLWGRRYLLTVEEHDAAPRIEAKHSRLLLRVRPDTDASKKAVLVEEWYRREIRAALTPLLRKWHPLVGAAPNQVFVQRMRTKWGSCNARTGNIRLNTELARKPRACLEYILVHELVHLLEPTHNDRFTRLMARFMPSWQIQRSELNRLPLRHETWFY
jgi:predicted metal-dependent hydrolase